MQLLPYDFVEVLVSVGSYAEPNARKSIFNAISNVLQFNLPADTDYWPQPRNPGSVYGTAWIEPIYGKRVGRLYRVAGPSVTLNRHGDTYEDFDGLIWVDSSYNSNQITITIETADVIDQLVNQFFPRGTEVLSDTARMAYNRMYGTGPAAEAPLNELRRLLNRLGYEAP